MKVLETSKENIRKLFIICNKLRENTIQVDRIIREIYEISLRSGISSSHVEVGKRAFNEIAKQIAKSSKKMEEEVSHIRVLGSEISNLSLECLKSSLQVRKMYDAMYLDCGQNTIPLKNAIRRMEAKVGLNVDEIEDKCEKIMVLNDHLKQNSQKLWTLSINLRMEASLSGEDEEMFFTNIAQGLVTSSEKLKEQGRIYEVLVGECRQIRGFIFEAHQELSHAA